MRDIYIVSKISPVPEIRNIMLESVDDNGIWSSSSTINENVSRDWLYWLCAFEKHEGILLKPRFVFPSKLSAMQKFSPHFPRNLGQSIDYLLIPDLIRQSRDTTVFATNNQAVSTVLFLKQKKIMKSRVYCVLHGIADKLMKMSDENRDKVVDNFNLADRQLVWGINEYSYLKSVGLTNITKLDFGVDTEFWYPDFSDNDNYILSVGWDNLRDYTTLVNAVDGYDSSVNLKIACDPAIGKKLVRRNISFLEQPRCLELRECFHRSKIVVVSTIDALRPSGQITILQAMACGKPVIMTETRGTWSDKLISGENCLFVSEKDSESLKYAINFLLENPDIAKNMGYKARKMVDQYYNFENMRSILIKLLIS